MSLFPVAIQSTRDSIADNYASDTADQMIALISIMARADWSNFTNASIIPSSEPSEPAAGTSCAGTTVIDNIKSGSTGIFKVTQGNSTVTDFSAFIKVWRTELPAIEIGGRSTGTGWDSSYTYGSGVHIQICYPAELPAGKRKTNNYYFEVFKNN
jgi:hypothetical protein